MRKKYVCVYLDAGWLHRRPEHRFHEEIKTDPTTQN